MLSSIVSSLLWLCLTRLIHIKHKLIKVAIFIEENEHLVFSTSKVYIWISNQTCVQMYNTNILNVQDCWKLEALCTFIFQNKSCDLFIETATNFYAPVSNIRRIRICPSFAYNSVPLTFKVQYWRIFTLLLFSATINIRKILTSIFPWSDKHDVWASCSSGCSEYRPVVY